MHMAVSQRWVRNNDSILNDYLAKNSRHVCRADQQKLTVRVSKDAFTETVVAEFIGKKSKSLRMSREQQIQLIDEHQKNYVLKVCGTQEFLLERYPICQYKVVHFLFTKLKLLY